ncbi:MerR family transcriptional regulator [Actinocrispum wychmicini]|uniref:DNA-binding transcriptional MerR regulator n=1 Tax=Actinocrispum wychmicini TaxID=1213861 RepID=A0A4V2S812_9PSEU|nr:MerR family transcriptional regulator [Actinocrispum wychmicini]TCO62060.1 DNA-binding transcriptional MerR regulator [Actinocrispum wychmicini]
MAERKQQWRIGELARVTGITVRTLHHYDRLGLLVPSSRTSAGHRTYTDEDIRRLHRIIALRGFGLSLDEIRTTLGRIVDDPRDLIRRQLHVLEDRIEKSRQVRTRLLGILGALDRTAKPSVTEFIQLIEEMISMDQPFTPEQVAKMAEERADRMGRLSDEELAEMGRKREEAMNALPAEQAAEMRQRRTQAMPSADGGDPAS